MVIGVKVSMVAAKNSVRISTRNYSMLSGSCLRTVAGNHLCVTISDVEPEVDRPCEPPQGPEQSRAGLGGDAMPADRSSELLQGHEQPGANRDTGE